jgi:hypothetical protein
MHAFLRHAVCNHRRFDAANHSYCDFATSCDHSRVIHATLRRPVPSPRLVKDSIPAAPTTPHLIVLH